MGYRKYKGYFVSDEANLAIKEPAFIINTDTWALIYFGEFSSLEKIFKTLPKELNCLFIKLDLSLITSDDAVKIINDFLFNKRYLKFQLYLLLLKMSKEDSAMAQLPSNYNNFKCEDCKVTVEDILLNYDEVYICQECNTVYCKPCYCEAMNIATINDIEKLECPKCGGTMTIYTDDEE